MFVPLLDKLNKIVPELHQQEEFDYYCSILPKMIANGHTAHQSIPGYELKTPKNPKSTNFVAPKIKHPKISIVYSLIKIFFSKKLKNSI
jgi:hypothetical protein